MNWKAIIALLVLLGAGLGTWLVVKDRKPGGGDTDPGETLQRVFPGLASGQIRRLGLVSRDGATETAVSFERQAAGWALTAGQLRDAGDPSHIRKVVEAFVKLRQRRAVPLETGTDYGLAPAEVELRATLEDGKEIAVRLGKVAWQDNLRYLQIAGEPTVRIVPDELYGHCRHDVAWFRDHHVVTIPNFDVQRFTVTTPAGVIELAKKQAAPDPSAPGVGERWRQTAPVEDDADTQIVQDFLARLYRDAQARRFIDAVPESERARYGLDDPFLDVTMTAAQGRTCRVRYSEGTGEHLGKTVPTLYALRDGRLFDCGPDHLAHLKIRDLLYFRSPAITPVNDKALNLLQVASPGMPRWSVVREGHKWSLAEPRRLNVEGTLIRLLPDIVGKLEAERYFDRVGEADWPALGVDDANGVRVKLADSTGIHSEMVVGNVVPDTKGAQRYVRLLEGDRIRSIPSRAADFLTGGDRGWLFFLSKQLWNVTSPSVSRLVIESREADGVKHGAWSVGLQQGAAVFTPEPGITAHAAARETKELQDSLSSLATLHALHWVQDGHANDARFGLQDEGWRLRVLLTVDTGNGTTAQRELRLGNEVLWPSFRGDPQTEVYARTGADQLLSGSLVFTLRPTVLEGLRSLVVK